MSPTARSLAWFRDRGVLAQVVERRVPYSNRTVDLFGFIDIVAVEEPWQGVLGVQVTTAAHLSERMKKLRTECADAMLQWLAAGNRLHLHGWAKRGARGKRKLWTLTRREIHEVFASDEGRATA